VDYQWQPGDLVRASSGATVYVLKRPWRSDNAEGCRGLVRGSKGLSCQQVRQWGRALHDCPAGSASRVYGPALNWRRFDPDHPSGVMSVLAHKHRMCGAQLPSAVRDSYGQDRNSRWPEMRAFLTTSVSKAATARASPNLNICHV
jgi:hypothetical protein